jgi:hypothetical protein
MPSKTKFSKAAIRQMIVDQLVAASPASLSEDALMMGLSYAVEAPRSRYVTDVLDSMIDGGVVTKIIEDQFGSRFTLTSHQSDFYGDCADE